MARMTYWAVLEKGEDGGFGVFFLILMVAYAWRDRR